MPEHPSVYICLLCGWQGQPRELARDQDGTRLFCPGCRQPASYLMDLSETPEEFLSMRRSSYLHSLDATREELKIKPSPELRKLIKKFQRIMGAEA